DTAATQTWSGKSPVDGVFRGNVANALGAFLKDSVAGNQLMKFLDGVGKVILELFDTAFEAGRQIHHQSADAEIRRSQSPTRSGLNQVHDLFPFAERVKENCHRADIQSVGAEPN